MSSLHTSVGAYNSHRARVSFANRSLGGSRTYILASPCRTFGVVKAARTLQHGKCSTPLGAFECIPCIERWWSVSLLVGKDCSRRHRLSAIRNFHTVLSRGFEAFGYLSIHIPGREFLNYPSRDVTPPETSSQVLASFTEILALVCSVRVLLCVLSVGLCSTHDHHTDLNHF